MTSATSRRGRGVRFWIGAILLAAVGATAVVVWPAAEVEPPLAFWLEPGGGAIHGTREGSPIAPWVAIDILDQVNDAPAATLWALTRRRESPTILQRMRDAIGLTQRLPLVPMTAIRPLGLRRADGWMLGSIEVGRWPACCTTDAGATGAWRVERPRESDPPVWALSADGSARLRSGYMWFEPSERSTSARWGCVERFLIVAVERSSDAALGGNDPSWRLLEAIERAPDGRTGTTLDGHPATRVE